MATLDAILDARGFGREAPLSLANLGELLPLLPGGGVPLYLRSVLWLQMSEAAAARARQQMSEVAAAYESCDNGEINVLSSCDSAADVAATIAATRAASAIRSDARAAAADAADADAADATTDATAAAAADATAAPSADVVATPTAPTASDAAAEADDGSVEQMELELVAPSVAQFVRLFASRLAAVPAKDRLAACLCENGVTDHVTVAELVPVLEDVLTLHPGLAFLQEAPEFQRRYAQTVLVRIFYEHDPLRTGKITAAALRRGALGDALLALERTAARGAQSINAELRYFSYEHFYVIFSAFCEVDTDHDMLLNLDDLLRYANGAVSQRAAERVYAARDKASTGGLMAYDDFIWFLLSEEHAQSPTALSYWFHLLDLDADGFISAYEMRWFYEEQVARLRILGQEPPVAFGDVMRQLLDAIKPRCSKGFITLADLRRSQMGALLIHSLTNIHKFVTGELQTAASLRSEEDEILTPWDRWAAIEYSRLSIEDDDEGDETANDVILYYDISESRHTLDDISADERN